MIYLQPFAVIAFIHNFSISLYQKKKKRSVARSSRCKKKIRFYTDISFKNKCCLIHLFWETHSGGAVWFSGEGEHPGWDGGEGQHQPGRGYRKVQPALGHLLGPTRCSLSASPPHTGHSCGESPRARAKGEVGIYSQRRPVWRRLLLACRVSHTIWNQWWLMKLLHSCSSYSVIFFCLSLIKLYQHGFACKASTLSIWAFAAMSDSPLSSGFSYEVWPPATLPWGSAGWWCGLLWL